MFRFLSKVWTNFREYIALVLLILVSLIILSQNKNPNVQKIRAIAFGSFATITSVVSDLINVTDLKRENEELRETNAKLMLQISRLREFGIVNKELKDLLVFKITLNAGKKDSVLPGMPVINDKGFIGIVNSVSGDFSIARTLNNVDLRLTVMDERSRINGILKWTGEELIIINIVSSIVPIPIPVGIVEEFRRGEKGVFSYIRVKPFADLTPVENVFILAKVKSKQIDNLELNFYRRQ